MIFATTSDLMAHQREAVAKVLPSRVGALFMDMGTGKSRTTIDLARIRAAAGKIDRVVWVVPVSVKLKIKAEILKHTDASPDDIYLFDDRTTDATRPVAFWIVVGVESIGQSTRTALALAALVDDRTMLVVDESGYIKNDRAVRSRRLIGIGARARYRLVLTGTPITQGIEDLYGQMKFLSPKILGYRSWWAFRTNHLEYSESRKGLIVRRHNVEYLAARMRPYVYQVRRDECVDLPPKIYDERIVEMTGEQWAAYEAAKDRFLETDVDEWDRIAVFRLFTALQTIASGFVRIDDRCLLLDETRAAAAIEVAAAAPDKVVIWTRWRRSLTVLTRLAAARWGDEAVAAIHGGIDPRERELIIDRWRKDAKVLILTQSVGGHGIDLVEGRTVIFHSDGYKYAERLQAEDRSHRIGQDGKVLYVTVRTDAGIDDRIAAALARKSNALEALRVEIDRVRGHGREAAQRLVRSL